MNSEELLLMRDGMATFGGSFVKALSLALAYASTENKERILKAFPEYTVERYGPGTPFYTDILSKVKEREEEIEASINSYQKELNQHLQNTEQLSNEIKNTAYKMAKDLIK